jgi:hypothetical protein
MKVPPAQWPVPRLVAKPGELKIQRKIAELIVQPENEKGKKEHGNI